MSKKLDDKIAKMLKASAHLQEVPKEEFSEDVNLIEAVKRDPKERLKEKIGILKEMAAFLKSVVDGNDMAKGKDSGLSPASGPALKMAKKIKKDEGFVSSIMNSAFGSDAKAAPPPPAQESAPASSGSSGSSGGGETMNSRMGNPFGKSKKKA